LTQHNPAHTTLARGSAKMEAATAGAPIADETMLMLSVGDLLQIIEAELRSYFSDPDVAGLILSRGEARYIAGRISQRVGFYQKSQGN
jgi:hypothetical protein